ncbi:2177_t:CDS:2 [Paraglomus brasilianum]|uniref:2177_t:CDS:1 n=1 Tax=Paraglomus brasilianum TaxID=144538 RepID=A0A9N9AFR4_9GLOM|nr:2177_t:CDS:2 [Paraglomus brasilianum]
MANTKTNFEDFLQFLEDNDLAVTITGLQGPWVIHDSSTREYFELTAKIDIAILDGEHQYLKVKAEIHDATLIQDPIFLAAKAFSLSSRFLSKLSSPIAV